MSKCAKRGGCEPCREDNRIDEKAIGRNDDRRCALWADGGSTGPAPTVWRPRTCAELRRRLKRNFGENIVVIISDSFGRPWREGLTEVAIGVAGMKSIVDYRGRRDPHGYSLHASYEAIADEVACAAGLVCGKLNRTPVCIVRGFAFQNGRGSARELIRPAKNDLFR